MHRIYLLLIVTLTASANAEVFNHLSGVGTDQKMDALRFSLTQRWNPGYLRDARLSPKYLPVDWESRVAVPHPPANSSDRTQAELDYLEALTPQRSGKLSEIQAEVLVKMFKLGSYTYGSLTTNADYPVTRQLILAAYRECGIATFYMKKKFDRIRPSVLRKDLTNAVQVPSHPAYPSGHATGAYMIAFLLQELEPALSSAYLKDAERIAKNREIAGLHYPSDTEAGRLLARQLTDLLLANPDFKQLLRKAQSEWR